MPRAAGSEEGPGVQHGHALELGLKGADVAQQPLLLLFGLCQRGDLDVLLVRPLLLQLLGRALLLMKGVGGSGVIVLILLEHANEGELLLGKVGVKRLLLLYHVLELQPYLF